MDGIYLRRNWGGEYENVAILIAIPINEDGYREVLGAAEDFKEDKCVGMLETVGGVFPEAKYNATQPDATNGILKVINAQEGKKSIQRKGESSCF